MPKKLFLLFEHAAGFALFERIENEEIAMETETAEKAVNKIKTFTKMVELRAFTPFPSSSVASENITAISEGKSSSFLEDFLLSNLPRVKKLKKAKFQIGISDIKLASHLSENHKLPCVTSDVVRELLRGVKVHFAKFIKGLEPGELEKAQLGLSHHFSQNKVKYSEKREDNMVIQSICLLDTVDKDINSFYMRIRFVYF
ncbi:snoRNP complex protein nop56 [Bonamia ostreae]|uniref:snoRNP complex protein nop56 n=1 Tax=Bonamia ostreae TaxID=126728 RepID=A0ABV2ASF0_9EUKA